MGKVTIEELNEKVHPKDTSATAAVLFQVGKTHFEFSEVNGFEVVTEIDTKIKVYKKEGYNQADHSVSYYTGGNSSEIVSFSKAVTYNLINDKIEKTKLKSDGEFNEKKNKYWSQKKIAMPDVKEGSIIEYKIVIRSPFTSSFPEWSFQKNIPVNYSEYSTYIPEYYIYNARSKGYIFPKVTVTKQSKSITFAEKNRSGGRPGQLVNTTYSQNKIDYVETRTLYLAENLPALKEEAYVNNIDNYTASIQHELSGKKMPNSNYENFATDWEGVVKKIYDNDDFGAELNKTGYFEKDIDAVLQGITVRDEKITAIFNYVKSRMNWNEYNSYYCDAGVKKAYQEKTGNIAEINLMLTSMLRYAGLDANPVLLSTRSNGITIFPTRTAFNYVIAAVEFNDALILLDATSKNTLPNILPLNALNWVGRIIRKDGTSTEVDLMPMSNSKEVINLMAEIDSQGKITGKVRDQYFDYNAFAFREKYNSISKDTYLEKLEKKYQGIEIGEYESLNNKDLSKPVVENYSFAHTNAVEIIGNKMYFSPMVFFAESKNPFTQETREYPVDFVFPHQDKYSISITIPEGYAIETLPQSKALSIQDNMANFKYNISSNGKQCQLLFTIDINQAIIGSEYYEALKSFYKEMVDKQNEKIVLIKNAQ
ncbi:MAG: transglutaminase domain-containing protein [Flavobacterium sp.]